MAWSTRRCLYHPPSQGLAVKFFPSPRPASAIPSRRFPFDRAKLTGDEGPRALAGIAQPALRGDAVLVVTQHVLQLCGSLRKSRRLLSGDRLGRLGGIARVLGEDTDPM